MKISEFKSIIDKANEYNPNGEVEIHYAKKAYKLGRISQSGILGNLYIEVGDLVFDEEYWGKEYEKRYGKK